MFHLYTYGADAKRGVILTADQADVFNRFTRSFFLAQENFRNRYGRAWTPEEPFKIPFGNTPDTELLRGEEDLDAYHRLIPVLEKQYWIRNTLMRRPIREEDMTGDFFVKKI